MRFRTVAIFLLVIAITFAEAKRSGGGRSRGSSGRSSSVYNSRKSKSSSDSNPNPKPAVTVPKPVPPVQPKVIEPVKARPVDAPRPAPKPSAPEAPAINKENANLQQNGRPVGWNVDGQKPGGGLDQHQKQNANPVQSQYPQSPNNQQGGYPQQPGYNPAGPGGYNPQNSYPGGYNPQNPYPGYYPTSNVGVVPPRGADHGHYYNSQAGYGQNPVFYNQQNSGYFGGGGNRYGGGGGGGYGGYGGYGGLAGYGGGYGMQKSGGIFGKNAFRNVMGGLFVWYLVSGLTRKPYNVYNYYNQPTEAQEEIKLPPNTITLCNDNVTTLCVPGTYALCTLDNKILCVSSMTSAKPCGENAGELCVNTTVPCENPNDPSCQNKTAGDNTTSVNLPCFTNVTLGGGQVPDNVKLPEGSKFCVTAMAVPDESAINSTALPPIGPESGNNATGTNGGIIKSSSPPPVIIGDKESSTVLQNSTIDDIIDSSTSKSAEGASSSTTETS